MTIIKFIMFTRICYTTVGNYTMIIVIFACIDFDFHQVANMIRLCYDTISSRMRIISPCTRFIYETYTTLTSSSMFLVTTCVYVQDLMRFFTKSYTAILHELAAEPEIFSYKKNQSYCIWSKSDKWRNSISTCLLFATI